MLAVEGLETVTYEEQHSTISFHSDDVSTNAEAEIVPYILKQAEVVIEFAVEVFQSVLDSTCSSCDVSCWLLQEMDSVQSVLASVEVIQSFFRTEYL